MFRNSNIYSILFKSIGLLVLIIGVFLAFIIGLGFYSIFDSELGSFVVTSIVVVSSLVFSLIWFAIGEHFRLLQTIVNQTKIK